MFAKQYFSILTDAHIPVFLTLTWAQIALYRYNIPGYVIVMISVNLIFYMPMKDNTTFFNMSLQATFSQEAGNENKSSRAGSPRRSTLDLIRSFARAYHCTRECSLPAGVILN